MFAAVEFTDFAVIAAIVATVGGGAAATTASYSRPYSRPADCERLQRTEHKLDLIMAHLGLDYTPPPKAIWQELATDPAQKIAAIKAYREQHGVGLAEAKRAVEAYITESGGAA